MEQGIQRGRRTGSLKAILPVASTVIFLLLVPLVQTFPQEITPDTVRGWLKTEPMATPYRDLAPSIVQVFEAAQSEGLPLELLFDKLKEGAAKRVPPGRLKPVLEGELNRLLDVRKVLEEGFGKDVRKDPFFLQGMKVGSLALLSGFPIEGLNIVCASIIGMEKMISLVPPLTEMHRVEALPLQPLSSFARALSTSSIPPAQYGTFVSLYLKAVAGRIPPADTLRIMTDVLKAGGGILQIERELARRWKR